MVNRIKKMKKWVSAIKDAGQSLMGKEMSRAMNAKAVGAVNAIPSFKNGGKVKKTGKANLHRGEIVLSTKQVGALKKLLK